MLLVFRPRKEAPLTLSRISDTEEIVLNFLTGCKHNDVIFDVGRNKTNARRGIRTHAACCESDFYELLRGSACNRHGRR